jgi:aminomethyltransferase
MSRTALAACTLRARAVTTTSPPPSTLVTGDVKGLKPGQIRYTLLLNRQGGIRDDLMATRPEASEDAGTLFLVVNAGTKDADFAHIAASLKGRVRVERLEDRALIALQGPRPMKCSSASCPASARCSS